MRRLVAALIALLLVFTLVGCGGGEEPADTAATDQAAPAPAPAPPADDDAATSPLADRSALSEEFFEPLPNGEGVPQSVTDRLADGKAMMLLFYNSDQDVTNDLRKQVDMVAEDNTGMIDLLTYNLGKSAEVDDSGKVVVDEEELTDDPKGQEAVSFARLLEIDHVPTLIVVDERDTRSSSRVGSSTPSCSSAKWSARPSRATVRSGSAWTHCSTSKPAVLGKTTLRLPRGCVSDVAEFVGQAEVVGPGTWLRRAIEEDALLGDFDGPAGTGKTSLAPAIASLPPRLRRGPGDHFRRRRPAARETGGVAAIGADPAAHDPVRR